VRPMGKFTSGDKSHCLDCRASAACRPTPSCSPFFGVGEGRQKFAGRRPSAARSGQGAREPARRGAAYWTGVRPIVQSAILGDRSPIAERPMIKSCHEFLGWDVGRRAAPRSRQQYCYHLRKSCDRLFRNVAHVTPAEGDSGGAVMGGRICWTKPGKWDKTEALWGERLSVSKPVEIRRFDVFQDTIADGPHREARSAAVFLDRRPKKKRVAQNIRSGWSKAFSSDSGRHSV